MSVVDLSSSSGVVTIDLNANPSGFYRLVTTEDVTSWSISGDSDGDGFLLAIAQTAGDTVSFTGLVDEWTNGVPTLTDGETVYFPVLNDGDTWVGESSNVTATDPANVLQTTNHTASGSLSVDADSGHNVEATLTDDVTGHTITNLNDGEALKVTYIASGAARDVDFTGSTEFPTLTNPGDVTIASGDLIQAVFAAIDGTTYLMSVTEAEATETTDPSLVSQTIAHSASGAVTIDAGSGHTVEITMTADITGHTLSNFASPDILSVYYLASGASRSLDFTSFTTSAELTNPGSITMAEDDVYRAIFIEIFSTDYLISVEQVV